MRKPLIIIILYSVITCSAWCQTPELPEGFDKLPEIGEILNDAEFVQFYEQRHGRRLSRDTLLPLPTVTEVPNQPPQTDAKAASQNPSRMLLGIVTQQLAQLDSVKSVLLEDLRNAETCGYRAMGSMSVYGGMHTDFQAGQYVSSKSDLDWAIHGDGFFVLRKLGQPIDANESSEDDETNTYYTRAGRFERTDDGKLYLKHQGETFLLQPEIGITFLGDFNDASWQLAQFDRPERLWRLNGVLFQMAPDGEKPEMTLGLFHFNSTEYRTTIRTREYEASNVDVAESLRVYRALLKLQSAILDIL
jgi:hypothetical protein